MALHNISTAQFAVNTTPFLISINGGASRQVDMHMILTNNGANTVYFGGSPTVTSSNGAILKPVSNNTPDVYLDTSANVYVVTSAGTGSVSVVYQW